jgi:hypothetical protein
VALGRAFSWAQGALWAATFFGEDAAKRVGAAVPAWLKSMSENKFQTAIIIFWVFNMVSANVMNTGAFEVFYEGELVSSKLQSGKLPRVDAIFEGIRAIQKK